MWLVPSPLWLATVSAREPSYRAISSTATATARLSIAAPPNSSATRMPRAPSSPSPFTTSAGNFSSWSHFRACGLTCSSQKSRSEACRARWLSGRVRSIRLPFYTGSTPCFFTERGWNRREYASSRRSS
jgi:hypothetical protein